MKKTSPCADDLHTDTFQINSNGDNPKNSFKPKVNSPSPIIAIRNFANSKKNISLYNQGRVEFSQGKIVFSDLTMEQVPFAKIAFQNEPETLKRLEQFKIDWPGGRDPKAPLGSYVKLIQNGELQKRIDELKKIRETDRFGVFKARRGPLKIGGHNLNIGEEKPLSGTQGSGTIYFSQCSMACAFCQYADIAHNNAGVETEISKLGDYMLELQNRGAHNIQLMTPSHFIVEILEAVELAAQKGLNIPLVYNTGGYEDLDALDQLNGIIDIYVPDIKFGDNESAFKYTKRKNYWDNVQEAVQKMHAQVGDLDLDARGVATRGLLIRHLVMPGGVANPEKIAQFLGKLSKNTYLNVMEHYRPAFAAFKMPEIARETTCEEQEHTREIFRHSGIIRGLDERHLEA